HIEKADNDGCEHALCSEIGHEVFPVQLGEAVDVARTDCGVGLFLGFVVWLVDGAAAGEYELGTPGRVHQQVDGAIDVGAHRQREVLLTLGNVMDSGQVDDRVGSKLGHHHAYGSSICSVRLRELVFALLSGSEPQGTAAQVVDNHDTVCIVQVPDDLAPDKTVAAGDENSLGH